MAVTPNFGWPVPVATDYVKDGWSAIADLGDAIDTTVAGLSSGALTKISTTTITAQSTIQLNNIFSSTYKNYRVILTKTNASAAMTLNFQMSVGGTASTANYFYSGWYIDTGSGSGVAAGNGTGSCIFIDHRGNTDTNHSIIDFANPFTVSTTSWSLSSAGQSATQQKSLLSAGLHTTSASYDGIKIATSTGNVTGYVTVYGYQD